MKTYTKGFVVPLVIAIVALLAVGGGIYVYSHKKASTVQTPTGEDLSNTQSGPSKTYDISDLGVQFNLPSSLFDLTHVVYNLGGEQAVNSVAFSSKRLEAAGCSAKTGPLGYLTYDKDKGGTIVAYARNSNLYYIQPEGKCKADASLQNWQVLQDALKSLVTDYYAAPTQDLIQVNTTGSNHTPPVVSSATPSTASVGALITIYGSGFLHTPSGGTLPQNQNGVGVVLKNSSGQQVTLWPTVWNMEVKENSITFNLPTSICLQAERGCGSSDPASYYMKITPGVYSVSLVVSKTGVTSNAVSLTVK